MTVPEIIEMTFKPKIGLNYADEAKLKRNLAILAELYFCDTKKQKWSILASRGFICGAKMALKNVLFDVLKRSCFVFDIEKESEKFLVKNNHILCE